MSISENAMIKVIKYSIHMYFPLRIKYILMVCADVMLIIHLLFLSIFVISIVSFLNSVCAPNYYFQLLFRRDINNNNK